MKLIVRTNKQLNWFLLVYPVVSNLFISVYVFAEMLHLYYRDTVDYVWGLFNNLKNRNLIYACNHIFHNPFFLHGLLFKSCRIGVYLPLCNIINH